MAVATADPRLSITRLGLELNSYLIERDNQPPSSVPGLGTGAAATVSGMGIHSLNWTYAPTGTPRGLAADGFVIFWELGSVSNPERTMVLVPGIARQWHNFVPVGQMVSYAIAAYRQTHKGIVMGPKQTDPAWHLTA